MFADANNFVMRFLVKRFTSLKELTKLCPPLKPYKPTLKTKAVPLEILDVDEGIKDNNITILESFRRDLNETDSNDVVLTTHISFVNLSAYITFCSQLLGTSSLAKISEVPRGSVFQKRTPSTS